MPMLTPTPSISELRIENTRYQKISCPNALVPNGCLAVSGRFFRYVPCTAGSILVNSGRMKLDRPRTIIIVSPIYNRPLSFGSSRRRVGTAGEGIPLMFVLTLCFILSPQPNTRVEQRVAQIEHQRGGSHRDDRHGDRAVQQII